MKTTHTPSKMPVSGRVWNAIYYRYRAGVAQIYQDRRYAGDTCEDALAAARAYQESKQ